MPSTDPIALAEAGAEYADSLLSQAAQQAAMGSEAGAHIQAQFGAWRDTADAVALHGLLPLALTLLILHEFYDATRANRAFSVRAVIVPLMAVSGALLAYGFLVGLITSVAGSQGDFATWGELLKPVQQGLAKRMEQYRGGFSLEDIGPFLLWLPFFVLVALFAVVAGAATQLLTIAQGMLLAIVLACGKTCIVVSLVPGINLGKSWAKYLAMLAAWSSVAAAINGVILSNPMISRQGHLAATGDVVYLIKLAALYLVYAIFILSVPKLTSAIFSGAGSAAPGVMGALGMGFMAAKLATGKAKAMVGIGGAGRGAGAAGPGGGGARAHKAPHHGQGPRRGGDDLGPQPPMVPLSEVVAHGRPGDGAGAGRFLRPPAGPSVPELEEPAADQAPPAAPGGSGGRELGDSAKGGGAPGGHEPAWSSGQFAAYLARRRAPFASLKAPPEQTAAMTRRVERHGDTLRRAYGDLPFRTSGLAPRERAIVDELDQPHGRFEGWEHGHLDSHDFAEARQMADRRMLAVEEGAAKQPSVYAGPGGSGSGASAASGASRAEPPRPDPAAPGGAPSHARPRGASPAPVEATQRGRSPDAPVAASSSATEIRPRASSPRAAVHARVVPRDALAAAGGPCSAPAATSVSAEAPRVHKLQGGTR